MERRNGEGRGRAWTADGLYAHLAIYAMVVAGPAAINWLTADNAWILWPVIAWGVLVAIHAVVVLTNREKTNRDTRSYPA